MTNNEPIIHEIDDQISILTINRPSKLNAINYEVADHILELLDEIEINNAILGVIITGAGDKAFSAGGDIHQFSKSVKQGVRVAVRDFVQRGQRMTARMENFPKPIIAAVNGIAFGGGCEITEAVHLAVASEDAVFSKPEINIGIPPTFGGTQRLSRLAGRKRALELLLTADRFSAHRALELGLINKIVPKGHEVSEAKKLLERILRHSPLAAEAIITAVTRGLNASISEGLQMESEQFARMVPTKDIREGLDAWIERREPTYSGT